MKCRSIACIWSETRPYLHRVAAVAVLASPPTLYTGGVDGSIFWWNLSGSESQPEIKPIAMLCGHAAMIADLAICNPSAVPGDLNSEYPSNYVANSSKDSYGALVSACTDGVLCVWSRSSGHCRRRRKLAPWVGHPSVIQTLPSNNRYVCIGCYFSASPSSSQQHAVDSVGGVLLDKHSHEKKPPKCAIVIVDTYTLAVVQTVLHGNLDIGLPVFMTILSCSEDGEKQSVILADSYGTLQSIPISHQLNGEDGSGISKNDSQPKMTVFTEGVNRSVSVFSCDARRNIIAFLSHDRCIFQLVDSGEVIGNLYYASEFSSEGANDKVHVTGGTFLGGIQEGALLHELNTDKIFAEHFILWSSKGYSVVYLISYLNSMFQCKPLCWIPAAACLNNTNMTFQFIELNHILLRAESYCFHSVEPLQWKSSITLWSLPRNKDHSDKPFHQCKMLGRDASSIEWIQIPDFSPLHETNGHSATSCKPDSSQSDIYAMKDIEKSYTDEASYDFSQNRGIVSSSMVISENLYAPFAVVYGYLNGEIEVVRFDVVHLLDSQCKNGVYSEAIKQYFRGHTSAVICLASHRMLGSTKQENYHHVLISGSMDCTVRIWDLDAGTPLTVMHQHVAPVRQIILPPSGTDHPWSDCFLSLGDDACVTLASLQTLRVERMFPGHPSNPVGVVWDGVRGYIACLCRSYLGASDVNDVLYIWDIKTGSRERVLRGTASHSMYEHFCKGISKHSMVDCASNGNTSASSLVIPISEDASYSRSPKKNLEKRREVANKIASSTKLNEPDASKSLSRNENLTRLSESNPGFLENIKQSINCSCPIAGVATLSFDLTMQMLPLRRDDFEGGSGGNEGKIFQATDIGDSSSVTDTHKILSNSAAESDVLRSYEEHIIRFSLSFLHCWDMDKELDQLLINDMKLRKPDYFIVSSGLTGDRGALTLSFPGINAVLELWKLSSEFCAMRSLTMVSLAQRMVSLSHSSSAASSALAAFYTRNFVKKVPDLKPPSLQLLVSFWQDDSEHVRMAARSLFHCAASRAIPRPLCREKNCSSVNFTGSTCATAANVSNSANEETTFTDTATQRILEIQETLQLEDSPILAWLESYELQDWISCVGGTGQDAMTSHIIVAAALAIWYPSLVKPTLSQLVVHHLVKLVMAMNEKYSCTAAELLAEGMDETWKACIGSEIPHLIGDIFFQIECVSGSSAGPVIPSTIIRETLIGILLPSLAMADIHGFLMAIESQIWSTASDSPVHAVALTTLIRVVRGATKYVAQYLDKVINFILQTMDPSNLVMRKTCLQSSLTTLKEVVRVFPMVALNETSTRLAVGDAIGETKNAVIRVYDMQSVTKIKVLDASAPLGLPSLLGNQYGMALTTVISALSFSPDGEGLVAFSEHGLMIRWWSLGSAWWEKLSRNYVPVQCTKLIFVPLWEGFSPKTTRTSVMASTLGSDGPTSPKDNLKSMSEMDNLKHLIQNLDLSYRLEWVALRKVLLTRHGLEVGTFQL
ncbi:hypothetical protein SAY86_010911 [Trapa natans]|uniref:Transducin/WD40 repeat-like superfamily protein n=1 Tax=Trapa natans TaxID=22666 RepID=A0AAN7LFI0_TRANT|nr:hypothetical protein SAY86_010911 [Trapa natans]